MLHLPQTLTVSEISCTLRLVSHICTPQTLNQGTEKYLNGNKNLLQQRGKIKTQQFWSVAGNVTKSCILCFFFCIKFLLTEVAEGTCASFISWNLRFKLCFSASQENKTVQHIKLPLSHFSSQTATIREPLIPIKLAV